MIILIWTGVIFEIRQGLSAFFIIAAVFVSLLIALASLRMAHAHQLLTLSEVRLQRTKRQIREQSQHLKLTLENISQGIAMTDQRGWIVVANSKFLQMLEPSNSAQPVSAQPSDLAGSLKQIINESQPLLVAGPGTGSTNARTYQTPAGRILKIVMAALPDNGLVATFEDITERRQRQLQLEAAKQSANAANRAKSEFLASMSHEIRTPMHGIIGMSQVLLESTISVEQRKSIETIAASGEALMTIINDILDYSRIEAGKLELRPAVCNLRHTLDELVTLMSARANDRNLELELNYPAGLPEQFNADMGRIRQVVTNMLGNAVKFTTGPRVEINVTQCATGEMSIAVKDAGPGISQSQIAVIFDEFTQLNAPANRKFAGTGLGLPISRRLATLMGGQLTVDSTLGVGSTFTFTINLPIAAPLAQAVPEPLAEVPKSQIVKGKMGRPVRILAAEDNKTNRQVLSSMLKSEAVEIILAIDGLEAVEKFKTERPDIILMDLWMPNLDGFQATNQIRALERDLGLTRTPIIALTANAVRGDRDKCLAADIDDYMSKPLYKRVLIDMINRWCEPRKDGDRFLLEPLYFREKRQPSNAKKSADSRGSQAAANVDEQRISVLSADLGAGNFERAVIQFRSDVRQQLEALERANAHSDIAQFRTAVEEIRSCSRNLGCVRLVNSCESMLKMLTGEGVIPAPTIAELNLVFQSTAKDLSGLVKPDQAGTAALSA
ncbi:MAG: ATP-binding protein [Hyphomicrobiaceae bacterium]